MAVVAAASVASAQPKSEASPLIGAAPVLKASASSGFVDDVVAFDGNRVAYVISDGTTKSALHVATLTAGKLHDSGLDAEQIVDISTVTLQPIAMQFVGQRIFVVGLADGKHVAGLVELSNASKRKPAGTAIYKLGPADHITVINRDGKPRVAVHKQAEANGVTKHTVELFSIDSGRRAQKGKAVELDATGADKKLELKVNHWSDGWTRAYGIKAGVWDKKEDTRAPDTEAVLDVVTGKITTKKIEDHFDQKKRFQALAETGAGRLDFLRLPPDGSGIQVWSQGKGKKLELDQSFMNYDPKTLQGIVTADGSGWLAIKVDPVNPDAVARKKADPEYFDIFRFGADGKAVRKARVYAKGMRFRFGVAGDRFWLMERNAGFERGSKTFTLYQLQ